MMHCLITLRGGRVITFEEWYQWDNREKLLFRLRRLPCRPGTYLLWYGPTNPRNRVGSLSEILGKEFPKKIVIQETMEMPDPTPDKIRALFPEFYRIGFTHLDF